VDDALKFVVSTFVLPPGGPALLVALGVVTWRWRPPLGRWLCLAGAVLLWLFSLPIVAAALATALGGSRALDPEAALRAEAIVILGGGVRPRAPEYGGDTLGRLTLERVRYGAHLARTTGLPVLVSGGAPEESVRPEAELMREAMSIEFGVSVRWIEARSRNTRENAANAAKVLGAEGLNRILLVMHGFDVRRATRDFEAAGFEVIAAPTFVSRWDELRAADFLPSMAALHLSYYGLYEVLALARTAAFSRGAAAGRPPSLEQTTP
jgi:uncharacterized SAM-binding protein YcdF (DUF218 family)